MTLRRRSLTATVAAALALAACSGPSDADHAAEGTAAAVDTLPAPEPNPAEGEVLVQADTTTVGLSILSSQLAYASAAAAVVTAQTDAPEATGYAEENGLPVLLLPEEATPEETAAIRAELDRLGATHVIPVGRELPDELADLAAPADGWELSPAEPVTQPWTALVGDEELATDLEPAVVAEGGDVVVATDPRASAEAISALAADPAAPVVAVGDVDVETLTWQVGAARTGQTLPGSGTQLAAGGPLYVALYGHPGSPVLGLLGEQGAEETVARAEEYASFYEGLTDRPVVPTLEIIATVASAGAGDDGNYSAESDLDHLRGLIDAATAAGQYVILDLQPGRTDFPTQARAYEEFLLRPNVGLALDPEWRLGPDQRHLEQIGTVTTAEVNETVTWLADLTRANNLPQKLLVLHSFTSSMVTDIDTLDVSRPELALVMHVDGQGPHGAKLDTWRSLQNYASVVPYWGWKNFLDEDVPGMMTPEQTMELVDPEPLLITYQ